MNINGLVKMNKSHGKINLNISFIKFFRIFLFFANDCKFINAEGNTYSLPSCLFNIIILLLVLIRLYLLSEINDEKNHLIEQVHIEEFFKPKKE